MERLRRLHSTNMKKINSHSIFDTDGDGDVDDDDLDIDGDGIVDDTEREMGRLAIKSAQSQRLQMRQQEAERMKSVQRLDNRLRQRRRASLAASHEEERQSQQNLAKITPAATAARETPTEQQGVGERQGEGETGGGEELNAIV